MLVINNQRFACNILLYFVDCLPIYGFGDDFGGVAQLVRAWDS